MPIIMNSEMSLQKSDKKQKLSLWERKEKILKRRSLRIPVEERMSMSHKEKYELQLCVHIGCHRFWEIASVCEFHYYEKCHIGRCNSRIIAMGTYGERYEKHINDFNPIYEKKNHLFFQTCSLPRPPPCVMEERSKR